MGAIVGIMLQVLAGMGIAWGADKVLPSQVPGYQPISPFSTPIKTTITVVALAIGALLVIFVSKKLRLNLFKSHR